MNHGHGNINIAKLNDSSKSVLVHFALPPERIDIALSLQESVNHSLDMSNANVDSLTKRSDLHLAVKIRLGLR